MPNQVLSSPHACVKTCLPTVRMLTHIHAYTLQANLDEPSRQRINAVAQSVHAVTAQLTPRPSTSNSLSSSPRPSHAPHTPRTSWPCNGSPSRRLDSHQGASTDAHIMRAHGRQARGSLTGGPLCGTGKGAVRGWTSGVGMQHSSGAHTYR